MSFASIDFVIFFAVVYGGCYLIERTCPVRVKELFLRAASYFFYGYWDWRFCFLLLFVTVSSYLTAKHADNKAVFAVGVIVPLLVLGYFKYANFFLDSASAIIGKELGTLRIILPVGISFYTFQALSYVIDVRRKKIETEHDFVRLALYVSFFPQLVAGPIVKASEFLPQLKEDRHTSLQNFERGIQIMAFGLFKKIVLADHLSVFVDDVYSKPEIFHWSTLLIVAMAYYMQIYLDFSGYSDMAIGCAKCFGYDFFRNFNISFISRNLTEFWRRQHISLSTWLKEYLYIPLGGNRKGKVRQNLNLFITMFLGDLWHGANWTFAFWGGLNGLVLILEKLVPGKKDRVKSPVYQAVRIVINFVFVSLTLIFFRAGSFATSWAVLSGIFTLQQGIVQPFFWFFVTAVIYVVAGTACIVKSREKDFSRANGFYPVLDLHTVKGLTVFLTVCGLILGLAYTGDNPFVYFQF